MLARLADRYATAADHLKKLTGSIGNRDVVMEAEHSDLLLMTDAKLVERWVRDGLVSEIDDE